MAAPYFVADAASVTVLRSLASSVFGKYSLNVPEGINLEDVHTFGAPDNELAYVGSLTKRRVGGLCRRFVRADVTVTAADKTDPDWVAESDVDEVLQEAAERVASDFFLESDISRAGLGPWIPYEDFMVGDRANIALWGRRVELPVTRIDPVISDHSVVDWKIHVGGQVVSDEDARLAENALVQKALVNDRRELVGLAKQVAKAADKAESAQTSADAAQSSADGAQATANEALASAGQNNQSLGDLSTQISNAQGDASQAIEDAEATAEALNLYKNATNQSLDLIQSQAIQANTAALQAQGILNDRQDAWNQAVTDSFAAQETLNANQGRWNKAVDDSLTAQATLNEKQEVWNQAAADALAAIEKADDAQDSALEAIQQIVTTNRQLIDGLALAERRRPRPVFATYGEYKNTYRDPEGYVEIKPYSSGDRGFQFTCLGTWTGEIIVRASAVPGIGPKVIDSIRIQVTADSRLFRGTPGAIDMSYIALDMTVFPM